MEILTPTLLEYWAVRLTLSLALPCTLSYARISLAGVRLARWKGVRRGSAVVVCGLAGALAPGLSPGTVLIPDRVGLADGRIMSCDPTLVQTLVTAALTLHLRPDTRPLLTAPSLIVGDERADWSRRGFVGVDMETGLLMEQNLRVATVRVVLDSPAYNISPDWLRPTRALLQPSLWPELFWLGRMAPQYALRAAQVLKVGLGAGSGGLFIC
jgi:hypothetical protein